MSGIPIPRTPRADTKLIHRLLTRDDPGHLDTLLAAHAGAVVQARPDEYQRHMDVLRDFAGRHHLAVYALRTVLRQIADGFYSRTYPLVRKVYGPDGELVEMPD